MQKITCRYQLEVVAANLAVTSNSLIQNEKVLSLPATTLSETLLERDPISCMDVTRSNRKERGRSVEDVVVAPAENCALGADARQTAKKPKRKRKRKLKGQPVGQNHHNAKLSDHEVWLIQELRESGLTIAAIAEKFEVSKTFVVDVCSGRRRGHVLRYA